jgi:hypothetical protein
MVRTPCDIEFGDGDLEISDIMVAEEAADGMV